MSDTPSPYPLNPYQPSTVTTTDASGFAVAGSSVPPGAIEALRRTRPWVLFIAVLGAFGTVFMVLVGLGLVLGGPSIQNVMKQSGDTSGSPFTSPLGLLLMGAGYLILAVLYMYPVIKLFRYSGAIKSLTVSGAPADLENALEQQKNFWKFIGILFIISIIAYIIIIGFFIAGAAASAAGQQRAVPEPVPVQTVP